MEETSVNEAPESTKDRSSSSAEVFCNPRVTTSCLPRTLPSILIDSNPSSGFGR